MRWPVSYEGPRPSPAQVEASLEDAEVTPFWLDSPLRPSPRPALSGGTSTDLVVVGGGFTGLWTALRAKERDPGRRVVLLERGTLGWAASGRNGGFCDPSLTHGRANGEARWPEEIDALDELGATNLSELEATLERYGIDCGYSRPGSLTVAVEPHQVGELREGLRPGEKFLDAEGARAVLDSPTYLAARYDPEGSAMLDPARLVWGLAAAAEGLGVEIFEGTTVSGLRASRGGVVVRTDSGDVRTECVALGTSAFPSPLRRLRSFTVPVHDYVLVSEQLSLTQRVALGWNGGEGVDDAGNRFHYYRLTPDGRLLWGGFDAIYAFGRGMGPSHDRRPVTTAALAEHVFTTFPALEGLRFTHTWGGPIDTCSRFCAFFGRAGHGRIAYALGYTGLGVAATRFGADVMLDLLSSARTKRTENSLVRSRPLPFPPEPFASVGIQATRWSLAHADEHGGHRNVLLRALDAAGVGFDS